MESSHSPYFILPDRNNCLLLVIDVQERLSAAMPPDVIPGVVRNTCTLIEAARMFNRPVFVSEQYPSGLGPTVPEVRAALQEGIVPVEKLAFSCCEAPVLSAELARHTQRDVILCGMETHVCVLQTALDLLKRGRQVYVAADAVCSRTKLNWKIGLDLMRQAGAVIGSTEAFAFGLLGAAGSEQFKQISRLVK